MIPVPNLRRLALLLALLPQLLALGLGSGVVICIAPGGHVQVEVTASACCTGTPTASIEATVADSRGTGGTTDCSSCTDLRIMVDTRVSRAPQGADANTGTSAALPLEASALLGHGQHAFVAHRSSRRELEPPHLLPLRSVLLRC